MEPKEHHSQFISLTTLWRKIPHINEILQKTGADSTNTEI